MGFFNRDYRCFDNDSIDTAAMFESIWETTTACDTTTDFNCSDSWSNDSFSSDCTVSWPSSDD